MRKGYHDWGRSADEQQIKLRLLIRHILFSTAHSTSEEGRFTPARTRSQFSANSGGKPPFLTCTFPYLYFSSLVLFLTCTLLLACTLLLTGTLIATGTLVWDCF